MDNLNERQVDSVRQIAGLSQSNTESGLLKEVTDHFKNTFSNVASGEATVTEYLEVGALAVGTAALATVGVGKLMQRNAAHLVNDRAATDALVSARQLIGAEGRGVNVAATDALVKMGYPISTANREAMNRILSGAHGPLKPWERAGYLWKAPR